MDASKACDVLGINRVKANDLSPMVKALNMHPWNNDADDKARLEAATWALKNWSAYQAECSKRRDARFKR